MLALTSGTLVALLTLTVLGIHSNRMGLLYSYFLFSNLLFIRWIKAGTRSSNSQRRYSISLIDAFVVFSSAVSVFIVILLLTISKGSRLKLYLYFSVFFLNLIQLLYVFVHGNLLPNNGGVSFNARVFLISGIFVFSLYHWYDLPSFDTNFSTTRFRKVALGTHSFLLPLVHSSLPL